MKDLDKIIADKSLNAKLNAKVLLFNAITARKEFITKLESEIMEILVNDSDTPYGLGSKYSALATCKHSLKLMHKDFKDLTGMSYGVYWKTVN